MCSFNPMLMLEYAKMTSKHEKKKCNNNNNNINNNN